MALLHVRLFLAGMQLSIVLIYPSLIFLSLIDFILLDLADLPNYDAKFVPRVGG